MDLRNFNGIELRNFYFTTVWKIFSKIFTRSGKIHHVRLNSGTSKSSKQRSFCTFEDINLRQSDAKLHEKPSETLGADPI